MGFLKSMAEPRAVALSPEQTFDPASDYWYTPRLTPTLSGVGISHETAMTISTVYACTRVISESIATLPLDVFERDGTQREKDTKHPLHETLHYQANPYQTATEVREIMTALALLRGESYAFIDQPDPADPRLWLYPLHPDLMEVKRYGEYGEVRRYFYGLKQKKEIASQDLLKLRGFDGIGIAKVARESMALTMATEQYGSRFFGQGQRPIGFLSVPQNDKRLPMKDEVFTRVKSQLKELYAGMENSHQIAVLEDGMSWQAMGISAESAQFLETRRFQTEEIARWFRVPPHKIGHLDKATYSNIEQQSIEFLTDCLRPWLVRWEQAIRRDLITDPARYFVEHNVDAILRGDTAARYAAYAIAIDKGILSPNEVRAKENFNAREDKWGDAYNRNLNQTTTVDPEPAPKPAGPPAAIPPAPPDTQKPPRAFDFSSDEDVIFAAATRIAGREAQFLKTKSQDVEVFYMRHADVIEEALCVRHEIAEAFCNGQVARLSLHGREKLLTRTDAIVAELVRLREIEKEKRHA